MLPKMSEEKATTCMESTITFSQNEVLHSAVPPKSYPYRKYAIIAVTGVVVAAVILTAIFVGMYLFTQGQKDILKFSRTQDDNAKEEVISDPNTNILQYHLTSKNYETWVIDDFNRDIETTKRKTEYGTNCYLSPLNRSTSVDPSKVSDPSDIKERDDSNTVTYRTSNSPIPDISFLSKAARDTCKGISTYWMYPSYDAPNNSPSRMKRQATGPVGPAGPAGSADPGPVGAVGPDCSVYPGYTGGTGSTGYNGPPGPSPGSPPGYPPGYPPEPTRTCTCTRCYKTICRNSLCTFSEVVC